jgi:uncharacterized damage-inducible protein DinB
MSAALDHLCLMARNNAYANARLHEACCRLSQEAFEAERNGFFPSIRETINHILEVDRYYVDALKEGGEGLSVYETPHRGTAVDLKQEQEELDRTLIAFCDGLTDADLGRKVVHDRVGKGAFHETVAATLLHLFQHQIHHRGQVHAMLSGTAVAPPQLDEFFLDFDRHPAGEDYP